MTDFDNLVIRAQQGSKQAVNSVIQQMYKKIYASMRKRWRELPGGYSLEDMVQFAIIRVCDGIKTYNGNGSAVNWLWLQAQSGINTRLRDLNYDNRKANINSSSLDKPITISDDEETTLGSVLPCGANTEQEALSNVVISKLIELLRSELSELEFTVMGYMMREYSTKDIIAETGYKSKTVDNTKERIKGKVRKYLVVA